MINIKINTKDAQNGKVMYNAVAEVEGAMPLPGKKNGISLYIEKDGIYVDVSVVVKYGYNVPELAYRIQQSVKQSVENMTRYKVAEVDVHVRDIVFGELPQPEKEEEEEAETEEPVAEKH